MLINGFGRQGYETQSIVCTVHIILISILILSCLVAIQQGVTV